MTALLQPRPRLSTASSLALALCVGAAGLAGCSVDPNALPAAEAPVNVDHSEIEEMSPEVLYPCFDYDHDGFGRNCERGPDCDDRDPLRATECGVVRANEGPECEDGEEQGCYVMQSAGRDAVHCGAGTRVCRGGLWDYCTIEEEFEVRTAELASRTGPQGCDPCDRACARTEDDPDDSDLTPENSEGVTFDAGRDGITLEEGSGAMDVDSDGDGVFDRFDAFPMDPTMDGFTENGILFHVLPFGGATRFSDVDLTITLNTADIFFLMDTTGSMQGEINNLRTDLTSGSFVLNPQRCGLPSATSGDWLASYYPVEADVSGTPDFTRMESTINYDWGSGGPDDLSGTSVWRTNDFSIKWEKTFTVTSGTVDYLVRVTTDDGVRVRVDGVLVINEWRDRGPETDEATVTGGPGDHTVVIEYYEDGGGALARASVQPVAPPEFQGLVGAIRCEIPDIAFGVGYYDDFPIDSYGYSQGDGQCNNPTLGTVHDLPFHMLLPETTVETPSGLAAVTGAIGNLSAHCGVDTPESLVPALWAISSGGGIPDARVGRYPAPPVEREPLVPGGLIYGAPVIYGGAVPGVDFDLGDVSQPGFRSSQSTTEGADNSEGGACNATTEGDHTYSITVTRRASYTIHLDTDYSGSLALRNTSRGLIECDPSAPTVDAEIVRTLDPGEYLVIVDGQFGDSGSYQLAVGETMGETYDNPYILGDLTDRLRIITGNTDPRADDVSHLPSWGGNSSRAEDIFFRFTLTDRTQFFAAVENPGFNSILRLWDDAGNLLYSVNGEWYRSHLAQVLEPGEYTVMLEGSGNEDGNYNLVIGEWQETANYLTPPSPGCAEPGQFGYPCFREGTIPIIIAFTDAETHNAPDARNRYWFPAPAYPDALYTLGQTQARFIGIHSGSDPRVRCNTPCLEWSYRTDCDTETYCAEFGPSETTCVDVTQCAEFGPPPRICTDETVCTMYDRVENCWDQRVCRQSVCWYERRCRWEDVCTATDVVTTCRDGDRPCLRTETVQDCTTTTPCIRTDTRQVNCRSRRDQCITQGDTTCTTDYARSMDHLRDIGIALGSVDSSGSPFVYQINSDGSGLSQAVVNAVNELANNSRLDVTLRVNDNPATPGIDESLFVDSIATVSTPANPSDPPLESTYRCLQTHATWFEDCLPGTDVRFSIGFRNDFVVPLLNDQFFTFTIDVLGDGTFPLTEPVTVEVVVPGDAGFPNDGWYEVEYDSTEYCVGNERPEWSSLEWNATLASDTSIRWDIKVANTQAELDAASATSITTPPTVSPLDLTGLIDTGRSWLRLRANLIGSSDRSTAPVLHDFAMQYICQPQE
ncbi:MAG: PA14 domain-containing protein [Sandaracinaceae bacterium]